VNTSLLNTKLYIPPSRPDLVPRPRLIERLNEGISQKLILVCAPAGFGKTTLVSKWVESLDLPVAWVSLDKRDNDRTSFLIYLVAALQTIDAGICETVQMMLHTSQSPPIETVLTELINDVAAFSQDFVLVLDDYQVIDDHEIDEALTFLLDHIPPVMHLIIISRSDPMLPLPRLRARNQMTELRTEDLRFTTDEVAEFLQRVMGLVLSVKDVTALETRTEGWIAGLQLAALSIQDKDNASKFITVFTGDDRYIVDYLVDEVLAQRPQGMQDFLLRTSILDRMSGSLCNAVTGQDDGQEQLERLEQANLFIVPLDHKRLWYRYHHLFTDVLRRRLAETVNTQEIIVLHQRASRWYEENEFIVEAVEHALAAEDFENVIRLIEIGSMEILTRGQQSLLLKWQNELPRNLVACHPRACMTFAWASLSTSRTQETEECIQDLERSLGAEMEDLFSEQDRDKRFTHETQVALVEIAVVRIELAMEAGDISRVFRLSQLVLPYLDAEYEPHLDSHIRNLRSVVLFVLGLAYKSIGKLSDASKSLSKAAELGQELGNVYIAAGSIGRLASVQSMQGQLIQAMNTCTRGLDLVEEMAGKPPMTGLIHAELGNLLYERNNLDSALHHLQEGINLAKPWNFTEAFLPGYTGLARTRAAMGDWDGAFAALNELAALGEFNTALVMPDVELLRASLWVAQGKVDAADSWVMDAGLDPQGEINYDRLGDLMVLARLLISRHAYHEAINLLTRMMDTAEADGWLGRTIEILVLLALAHQKRGDNDKSLSVLEQALISAKPEGYVRVFVDEGGPMKSLLRETVTRDIMPGYVQELLAALETDRVQVETASASALIEPLSERELEVLHMLKTDLSGPEIARELVIALSTMRTHTQNIYSKLGVSNRREAVRKAEELNLR
jgi:LuxR family maltose regulon positive regulatory protein